MFRYYLGICIAFLILLSGCTTPPPEMVFPSPPAPVPGGAPAPTPTRAPASAVTPIAFDPTSSPILNSDIYPVWYATNRKPISINSESRGYTSDRSSELKYGKVYVRMPNDYLEQLRSQNWIKKILFRSPESKLEVVGRAPITQGSFFSDLRDEIAKNSKDERYVLVYIHGYNTTFDEAAQRAASIGYQLKAPTTAFFSWPSQGRPAAYVADKNAADISAGKLASFLVNLQAQSGTEKIHIIAHSMGNDVLLQAIEHPILKTAFRKGLKFGQIILAAPDVDADRFAEHATAYPSVADRVTLYASNDDSALSLSKGIAKFPRAGLLPPIMRVTGIDSLDVSSVNLSFLGHAFVASELAVLEDMHKLITQNAPPGKRTRITPVDGGLSWVLR